MPNKKRKTTISTNNWRGGQDNIMNASILLPTMGHTSSSIFRNIALNKPLTQEYFKKATQYDIYGGDSFRNFLHLMYGHSYHCTDVDSVYNMHGNGDWSANGEDLQDYRNAVLWHDFWEFSGKRFLLFISMSCGLFRKIADKIDNIQYTNNDNPKQKIPQMLQNYEAHMDLITNLFQRFPNA